MQLNLERAFMSTVIGRLSFSHSANADIDFIGLIKEINKFTWSDSDLSAKWVYSLNEGMLLFESEFIEDPTALPKIYIVEIEDEESNFNYKINAQMMTDADHENLIEINGDYVDFKQFAKAIESFIHKGSIQIRCNASDRNGLSYWEQITVDENGMGVASWNIKRANGEIVEANEMF